MIVRALRAGGLIVAYATDCWSDNRRNLLSTAKVVLNVRNGNAGLLETTRLVSLISSGINCISESSKDLEEDNFFSQFIGMTDYDNLVGYTLKFLQEYNLIQQDKLNKASEYFSDTFEKRVESIFSKLVESTENIPSLESKCSIVELLGQGLYVSARKKIISSKNSAYSCFVPAIDYILDQHNRVHDVIDSLPLDNKINLECLTLYCELLCSKWLPDEVVEIIKSVILGAVKSKPRTDFIKHEYTLKLLLKFLSSKNEIYLFLKIFPNSLHLFDYGVKLLGSISVSKIVYSHVCDLLRNADYLSKELALHLCAEIYWKVERTADARESYQLASRYVGLNSDHYEIVGNRLMRYGDYITAQSYFEKSGCQNENGNATRANEQANSFYLSSTIEFDAGKIAFALERNTSTKVFVKLGSLGNSPTIYIGGIPSMPTALPVLDGDIRIYDRKIANFLVAPVKALGIIACYNEIDVIEQTIRSMIANNLEVYIIDNWSNDGTYELLKILSNEVKFELERFPLAGPSETYDWTGLLARKEEIAMSYPGYWIVHGDADEIRISPWSNVDLATAFGVADRYGSNAIDYIILNYKPVDDGFVAGLNPESYFQFFEIASANDLKYQIKTWKQGKERVDLVGRGGHFVQFYGRKVFPYKFICKHYPLRSIKHAGKKINFDRKARFSLEERARGWHSHYDNIDASAVQVDWKTLYRWNADTLRFLTPYLVQGI